jgi:hypothetical protein
MPELAYIAKQVRKACRGVNAFARHAREVVALWRSSNVYRLAAGRQVAALCLHQCGLLVWRTPQTSQVKGGIMPTHARQCP